MTKKQKIVIEPAQQSQLLRAMHQVYQAIANDLDTDDREEQVEAIIDADRLESLAGDPDSGILVQSLVDVHGYGAVLKHLAQVWR